MTMARATKTPLVPDHPMDYEVIGEHRVDPMRLLVFGADGRLYALDLVGGDILPTNLSDQWVLDVADLPAKLQRMAAA